MSVKNVPDTFASVSVPAFDAAVESACNTILLSRCDAVIPVIAAVLISLTVAVNVVLDNVTVVPLILNESPKLTVGVATVPVTVGVAPYHAVVPTPYHPVPVFLNTVLSVLVASIA